MHRSAAACSDNERRSRANVTQKPPSGAGPLISCKAPRYTQMMIDLRPKQPNHSSNRAWPPPTERRSRSRASSRHLAADAESSLAA